MTEASSAPLSASAPIPRPTEPPSVPGAQVAQLSHRQQAALAALSNGRTIRDAAKSIGVNRNTVARWLRTDPRFRAAYNAWRQELIDSTRSRLLRTAELAAAAVHKQIAKGDGRLALALLDRLGLASDAAAVAGPPDAEGARDEIAVERAEHSHALHVRVERARLAPFGYFDEQHLAPFRQQVDEHARQTDEPTQPGDPKLSAMPGPNP